MAPHVLAGRGLDSSRLEAPAASTLAGAGEIVVVDVRGAPEWARTGVPGGAKEISQFPSPATTNGNFINQALAAVGGDKSTPVATIRATGVRSPIARDMLLGHGFTAVHDISEGMFGSTSGPGWPRRGLPAEPRRTR